LPLSIPSGLTTNYFQSGTSASRYRRLHNVSTAGELLNGPRRRAAHRKMRAEGVPEDVRTIDSGAGFSG
jgi:hypothetical protein